MAEARLSLVSSHSPCSTTKVLQSIAGMPVRLPDLFANVYVGNGVIYRRRSLVFLES